MNFLVNLEEKGHAKNEIKNVQWTINHLNKNANINEPETVEQFIKKQNCTNNYKRRLCYVYKQYCNYKKMQWNSPHYTRDSKEIRIPTHEKIQMIIADAGKILSLKIKLSLETGLRPVELQNLKVKDLDTQQKTLYPTTAKHGAPRKLKITENLTTLIQAHINRNKREPNETIFKGNPTSYGKDFREVRNRLAKKLNDPSIHEIRLYDLRHYFGTITYQKTKDLKHTQYLMGHKHSNTTDIYIHLSDNDAEEEYTCKVATNIKEATELIETGFQYVTEMEGLKIFKKRK